MEIHIFLQECLIHCILCPFKTIRHLSTEMLDSGVSYRLQSDGSYIKPLITNVFRSHLFGCAQYVVCKLI